MGCETCSLQELRRLDRELGFELELKRTSRWRFESP